MNGTNKHFYQAVNALIQNGQTEKALAELESFLDTKVDDEVALSLYGLALIRNGDTERALSTFKHAAEVYPDAVNAHENLAFIAMKAGDREQAIESYERTTRLSPASYRAWVHLGKLYFDAGDFEAALQAVDKAEKLDPLKQDFQQMQSVMQSEDFAKAEEIARLMLTRQPGHPHAIHALAHLAGMSGAHEESTQILSEGLEYHPANIRLREKLVGACEAVGNHVAALQHAKMLVRIKPGFMSYRILNRVCSHVGDYAGALSCVEKAAAYVDEGSEELVQLDLLRGHWLKILGRRKESESAYRDSIRHSPACGAGWWGLADLKTYRFSAEDKQVMENLAGDNNIPVNQRCQAGFALAKAYDNDGDHARAFLWYQKANNLRPDIKYSATKHRMSCQESIAEFDHDMLAEQARPEPAGPTPIFIVGMPRTGSTLIEQILASHSQIEGTMELMTLPYLKRTIRIAGNRKFNRNYPQSLRQFSQAELGVFGQAYLDQTAVYRTSKPFFIDKLPANFERVGLIHKILPQAIILDSRRNPLDCGYSAYKQLFAAGHDYSYSLENIGEYFNIYLQLMDHWDSVLPGKVKLVQYEEMVHDTENTVRGILDHIGVGFEQDCLRFFENKRAVKTASSEQVRQPIYTKSIGRWQTVSDQLKPLIDSLGEETISRFQQYL
jgi:tetratricopeptide (TPR) repeat protein